MKTQPVLGRTQLFWFFMHAQIGVGLFSLPANIYEHAQTDGWISLLVAGVIVQLVFFCFYILHKRFPNETLFGICQKASGKVVGKLLIFLLVVYFIAIATLVLKGFTQLIAIWILNKTPETVFVLLFVSACLPMLFSTLKQMGRMLVVSAPIVLLIPVIAAYAFVYGDYLNLLPVAVTHATGIMRGVFASMFAINGFIVFSVVLPYVKGTEKEKLKVISAAHWTVTAIYIIVLLTSFITFSHGEMKLLPEPYLYMIKSFSLTIIERLDLIFLSIWSLSIITTYVIFVYCGSIGILTLFNSTRYRLVVLLVVLLTVLLELFPLSVYEFSDWVGYINRPSAYLTFLLPVLLVIFSTRFKKRRGIQA
ncbi:spore germination protein (amino acid permease) [Alkalihalobacillus xiaoxiensis]|uniref:Spore germination protein (Amino acid permease) n=1 Tax=Shouchella xiaoxiensis TaxID=766895 RepID=A0ABS2SNH7_9BACI|nr:endospore germination permease [Shouchella xiaoxiensis]MBM7837077.1 spore germination protein (amino acid permease) [Shouchella xiaoxiensis]